MPSGMASVTMRMPSSASGSSPMIRKPARAAMPARPRRDRWRPARAAHRLAVASRSSTARLASISARSVPAIVAISSARPRARRDRDLVERRRPNPSVGPVRPLSATRHAAKRVAGPSRRPGMPPSWPRMSGADRRPRRSPTGRCTPPTARRRLADSSADRAAAAKQLCRDGTGEQRPRSNDHETSSTSAPSLYCVPGDETMRARRFIPMRTNGIHLVVRRRARRAAAAAAALRARAEPRMRPTRTI